MLKLHGVLQNLQFSSNFDLCMPVTWQWYTVYGWFWCQFNWNFNRNILILNFISLSFHLIKIWSKILPLPLNFLGAWKNYFFLVKKIQTQKIEGIWDFKYELVMTSTSPHNKFIFIVTSDPQILSLNFFTGYFYSKLSIFGKKSVCIMLWGKFWSLQLCIFDIIFGFYT